jgi:hypothetical protein
MVTKDSTLSDVTGGPGWRGPVGCKDGWRYSLSGEVRSMPLLSSIHRIYLHPVGKGGLVR